MSTYVTPGTVLVNFEPRLEYVSLGRRIREGEHFVCVESMDYAEEHGIRVLMRLHDGALFTLDTSYMQSSFVVKARP